MEPRLFLRPVEFQCAAESSWRAPLAFTGPVERVGYRQRVVEVVLRLRQQKHLLMRARGPIRDALRHGGLLGPDDLGAQPPALPLEFERGEPRNPPQVLRLPPAGVPGTMRGREVGGRVRRLLGGRIDDTLLVSRLPFSNSVLVVVAARAARTVVGGPEIQPRGSIGPQHATNLV